MKIEEIVNVVFAVSALFALAVMLKHDMQMMQQNSYRNERYSGLSKVTKAPRCSA